MPLKLPSLPQRLLAGVVGTLMAVANGNLSAPIGVAAERSTEGNGPATSVSPPQQLGALVQRAIVALETRQSISARVRQSVDLFGRQLVGSGTYLQQRSDQGVLFRLEMRLQLDDQANSFLEVNDGRYLWWYRKQSDGQSLTRVDLTRVAQAMMEAGRTPAMEELRRLPGTGGLANMLRGVQGAFDFVSAEEVRIWQQVRAVKVRGTWKTDRLVKILPEQREAIEKGRGADLSKLPEHLPDHVVLWLGIDDLFPFRIEYRRRNPGRAGQESSEDRLLVGIDFFAVSFDVPIDPARFLYDPGRLSCSDETDAVLRTLGLRK